MDGCDIRTVVSVGSMGPIGCNLPAIAWAFSSAGIKERVIVSRSDVVKLDGQTQSRTSKYGN